MQSPLLVKAAVVPAPFPAERAKLLGAPGGEHAAA